MISTPVFAVVAAIVAVNGAVFERAGPSSPLPSSPLPSSPLPSSVPPSSTPPSSLPPSSIPPSSSSPASVPPVVSSSTARPVSSTIPPPSTSPFTSSSTPPPSSTSSPSGTANCNGVQQWLASFAYTAGNQVIYNNQLFTARQWTYNNAPPAHPDQWTAGGTCAQPISNQVDCTGVGAWQQGTAYTAGNKVTFNGHLWSAVQWTQSNSPGDASGTWQDLGGCK